MKTCVFRGSGVALVTPMYPDGSVNYVELGRLIDFHLENQTDALVIAGTTGECSTLTDEEHLSVIEYAVKRAHGMLPVIAGVGSNCTVHAAELSREAERLGADALLHVTPYYNKTSQEGLYRHFRSCAEASHLPIILYNVPSRTEVNIRPETYRRLSDIDNIVAVKEADGSVSQLAEIRSLCGDDLAIYSGNDDQITAALALGASGVISVLANLLPRVTHSICQSFFEGDVEKSASLQLYALDLIDALFCDVSPIPVKRALNAMGYAAGPCRLPLCGMEPAAEKRLLACLWTYGLLP